MLTSWLFINGNDTASCCSNIGTIDSNIACVRTTAFVLLLMAIDNDTCLVKEKEEEEEEEEEEGAIGVGGNIDERDGDGVDGDGANLHPFELLLFKFSANNSIGALRSSLLASIVMSPIEFLDATSAMPVTVNNTNRPTSMVTLSQQGTCNFQKAMPFLQMTLTPCSIRSSTSSIISSSSSSMCSSVHACSTSLHSFI